MAFNSWKWALAGGAVLIGEYFAFPNTTNQNVVYSVLGKAAVVCILVGVRLRRPNERLGWYFLAAAVGCFSIGDDITTYFQLVDHTIPFPSWADALYLSGYPFLFAGVIRLTSDARRSTTREDSADAAVIALGALAISWQFLMSSYVHDVSLSGFGMLVNVAYPMMDIALIFIIFRALLFRGTRYTYQNFLAASMVTVFVGDFAYDLLTLHNSYTAGNAVDALFLTQYVLLGSAALHPSTSGAAPQPAAAPAERLDADIAHLHRMPLVFVVAFIAPAILITASALGDHVDVAPLAILGTAVLAVISARLIWLISGMKSQSLQLQESVRQIGALEERFRLAFEDNMSPMLFTDLDDRVIAANDAFCLMIGFSLDELLGRDSAPFTFADDIGITEESHSRVSSGDSDQSRYIKRYVRKDGRIIVVEVLRSLARDADGQPLYNIISERDITEERTLAAELSSQALHDSLTGLANRALFVDRLDQAHARVLREGGLCAVLLLDLDDFKGVNDSLGHVAGDQLLIEIARRLEKVTRTTDTLSRFGGDEFLYLAEGIGSLADAEHVAARLLEALTEPFVLGETRIEQRASIGIVVSDGTRTNQTEFIQDADVALYEAKREGKGHYVLFTPTMHQQAASRFTLVQELRRALQSDQIMMHYQPVVDLSTSEIVGFEALMRWRHPERGWVPPNEFIPYAEQSELILELGYLALRQSVAAATRWRTYDAAPVRPFVTVNLSARQFHDPILVSVLEGLLGEFELAHESLIIEITESVLLSNVAETMDVIDYLRRLGISFALDDFGTGYSSLSYLARLQPTIIKIDQSFISPASTGARNDVLLEAIIALGHSLDMTMLAEGIETPAQRDRLLGFGCELGQGFLWSPAVSEDAARALLGRHAFSHA